MWLMVVPTVQLAFIMRTNSESHSLADCDSIMDPSIPQLFALNAFSQLIKFLLGVDPESVETDDKSKSDTDLRTTRRKWTSVQSREFGNLHKTLAYMGRNSKPLTSDYSFKKVSLYSIFILDHNGNMTDQSTR